MADIINIFVNLVDNASRKMDDIADKINARAVEIEKRSKTMGSGFQDFDKKMSMTEDGARNLSRRLNTLEVDLNREANAVRRVSGEHARARDVNRDYETSFTRLAKQMRVAGNELEKAGFLGEAEDMRDRADQLDHSVKIFTRDTDTMSAGLRRSRLAARDLSRDLRDFGTEAQNARRGVDDLVPSLRRLRDEDDHVQNGLQRLLNSMERWRAAKSADMRSNSLLRNSYGNLNTTIDRQERRFLILLTLVPALATLIYGLAGAVTSLVAGLGALMGAFSALSGILVAIPGALAAIAGGLTAVATVIRPAVTGIMTGVQQLRQLPGQQAVQEARGGGPEDQVQQAEDALARARESGVERVTDAERSLARVRRDNIRQLRDSEIELSRFRRDAAERERDAVQRLADIRTRSKEREIDLQRRLNDLLRSNKETEEELRQNLALARASQAGAVGPTETLLAGGAVEDAQAQLNQFLRERKTGEKELQDDLKRTRRDANQDVKDAEEDLFRLRRDNNERLKDMEQDLRRLKERNAEQEADAVRSLARTRRDVAQQQEDAQKRLAQAQEEERQGILATNAAWQQLSPTQRRIAREIVAIVDEFKRLTAPARGRVFGFIEETLDRLETGLPTIARQVTGFTDAILDVGRGITGLFDDQEFVAALDRVATQAQTSIRRIGGAFADLIATVVHFADAGRPMIDWITGLIEKFGEWARATEEQSEKSGRLAEFFAKARDIATLLGNVLRDLFVALKNIGSIGFPFGRQIIQDWADLAAQARAFTESFEGQNRIEKFFRDSIPVFLLLERTLGAIVRTIFEVGNAANEGGANSGLAGFLRTLNNEFLPAFGRWINQTAREFGPILGDFFREFGKTITLLSGSQGPLATFIQALTLVLKAFNALPGPIQKATIYFLFFGRLFGITGAVSKLFGDALKRLVERVVVSLVIPAFLKLGRTIAGVNTSMNSVGSGAQSGMNRLRTVVSAGLARVTALFTKFRGGEESAGLFTRLRTAAATAMAAVGKFATTARTQVAQAAARMASSLAAATTGVLTFARAMAVQAVRALVVFGRASLVFLASNPLLLAFAAIVIAIVLVATHFDKFKRIIGATFDFFKRATGAVVDFFRKNWKMIALILVAPFIGIPVLIAKNFDKIKGFAQGVLNWFRDHWKLIAALVVAPFITIPFLIFRKFFDTISGAAKDVANWFRDHWKPLILGFITAAFIGVPAALLAVLTKFGKDLVMGLVDGIKNIGEMLYNAVKDKITGAINKVKGWFGIGSPSRVTAREVGEPLGEGVVTGMSDALDRLGPTMQTKIRDAVGDAIREVNRSQSRLRSALGGLQSALGLEFDRRLAAQTPAERALARLDEQERQRERNREQREAASAVSVQERRLARLRAQERQIVQRGTVVRGGVPVGIDPDEAKRLAENRRQQREAAKALRDAQASRREVENRIALEDKRDALQRQAEKERALLEKAIEKQRESANKQIEALVKTINSADSLEKVRNARNRLIEILANQGIYVTAGNDVITKGLVPGLEGAIEKSLARLDALKQKIVNRIKISREEFEQMMQGGMPGTINPKTGKVTLIWEGDASFWNQNKAEGGEIFGPSVGKAVRIIAHVGEWVVNPRQQQRLARVFGGVQEARDYLFGHSFQAPRLSFAAGGPVTGSALRDGGSGEPVVAKQQFFEFNLIQKYQQDIEYIMERAAMAANSRF